MAAQISLADVEAVDRFLAEEKHLYGEPPEFGPAAHRYGRSQTPEYAAVWPIADARGVFGDGQLRIIARPGIDASPSLSLLFRGNNISRLDFVSHGERENNPPWAFNYGLPPSVAGPHFHDWRSNREHVMTVGRWELPCREALPPQVRRIDQALPWLADRVNLVLTPSQRAFEIPAKLA